MRFWSIHPKYLDVKGLVALWREALLAQKVLKGETKGYKNHPQLIRFKKHSAPLCAIATYLNEIWEEASRRGYNFNKGKIERSSTQDKIPLTQGQLHYEFEWLCKKLKNRDPQRYRKLRFMEEIECNALFQMIKGPIEEWEKAKPGNKD